MTDSNEESIYHLLPTVLPPINISSMRSNRSYRSMFAPNVLHERMKNRYSHRTMGPAIVPKPDPSHPLRRRQNHIELPDVVPFIRPHRLPPIPKIESKFSHEMKPSRNFIQENITRISHALPTCPRRFIVSDRKGNKYLIDGSGLQKDFIHKKEYGQVPFYLKTRRSKNESNDEPSHAETMTLLPADERLCLIQSTADLKFRYEEVFADFQRLPLRPETVTALMKKAYLTEELVSLEHDIDLLEKHQQIFIVNNYSEIKQKLYKNRND